MKTRISIIGMLLLVTTISFAQRAAQTYNQFSFDAGYTFSSLKENDNPNRPLFAGDGINLGIGHRWGDRWGIASRVGFTTGSVSQSGLQNSVDGWRPIPPSYRSEQTKSNWSQLSVMTGPSIQFGKKRQFELSAMGGIGYNPSPNTIKIIAYEQEDIVLGTVYEEKEKSVVGMWQVNAKSNLIKLNKSGFLSINAGYGSNGLSVGVSYDYVGHVTLLK